ncbi:MOSC domain-containing protein [Paracoccus aurantiacus]|uniref:MOSC domain-containing protein n=1 Tax=Paracoccus aurantiacus TaxID=2599412 RepID=A0A5C6S6D4_9RHOB|nr:MOSC domain-containing protein [Paracoccus aurantiacus]TXB69969.1 MOSC domain-containing protein [Paracoccus aurantiacus]
MSGLLEQIWRYPLKSIGRQRIDSVRLTEGERLPWDRHWAVLHEGTETRLDDSGRLPGWLPKSAFLRGVAGPSLQAVTGGLVNGSLMLSHPVAGDITVDPGNEAEEAALIDWLMPLWPENKPAPAGLVSGPSALTDSKKPYVSVNSMDSLHELETQVGRRLGTERWRGNLWVEGFSAFEELDWIGRTLSIGQSVLRVIEPIGRCAATSVDTETGEPDIDMVRILTERFGHNDFGVYAEVLTGGHIAELNEVILGDAGEVAE